MKPTIIYGVVVGAILIASIASIAAAITTSSNNALASTGSTMQSTVSSSSGTPSTNIAATDNANITKIQVGGGNSTVQYYIFAPQTVEINAGQSVRWYSPAEGMSEFHTVTFVLNQSLDSDVILPFEVSNNSQFKLLPPANAGEPLTVPTSNGSTAVLAANKLTFSPAVMNQGTNSTQYLTGTDIRVTLNGTEQAINSGIFQPKSFFELMSSQAQNGTTMSNNDTTTSSGQSMQAQQQNSMATTVESNSTMSPSSSGNTNGQDQQSTSTAGEQGGPPIPFVKQFTVTFEKPGTYDYFCAFHPWMAGQVIVK
jgi:plastocyanin